MKDDLNEVWVALIDVVPMDGNDLLGDSIGAVATVMAMATGPRDFRAKLRSFMNGKQFEIIDLSDAEPLELRLEFAEMNNQQAMMAKEAKLTGMVQCGTLEAYDEDDED